MTGRHRLLFVIVTLGLWIGLMRLIGTIRFSPDMSDALVRFTGLFGIYGTEAVENLFYSCAAAFALATAIAMMSIAGRTVRRRRNARRARS